MDSKINLNTSSTVASNINTNQAEPSLLHENPETVAKRFQETAKKLGADLKNPEFIPAKTDLFEASAETVTDSFKATVKKIGTKVESFIKAALKK